VSVTRRVSRRLAYSILVFCAAAGVASPQAAPETQGGLEFILPIGARTLGMGQAATAAAVGSDALWWNPALIARGPREAALQVTQTLATQTGTDAGFAFIYAMPKVGAFGLSLRYLNFGEQVSTDTTTGASGAQIGSFFPQSTIFAATFAAPFGDRLALGLTAKLLRIAFPCTGSCPDSPASSTPPQTGALDLGAQYIVTSDSALVVGLALRNIGFKLQINDTPQADALPSRLALGVASTPKLAQLPPDVRLRAAADIVWAFSPSTSPGLDLGGELSYKDRYQLRAGYVVNGPTGSGLTFGVGVSTGKLHVDLARMLTDVGQQSGVTPTFIALRYLY
jgi:hypothetical protein